MLIPASVGNVGEIIRLTKRPLHINRKIETHLIIEEILINLYAYKAAQNDYKVRGRSDTFCAEKEKKEQ